MSVAVTHSLSEADALGVRRLLNDLRSVLALPALWSGRREEEIAHTLAPALLSMLQLDLVGVRFDLPDAPSVDAVSANAPADAVGLARALRAHLGERCSDWPASARMLLGGRELSLAVTRVGLNSNLGAIVAGSAREDFPAAADLLLLQVFANQAAVSLHEARLLRDRTRAESALQQSEAKLRAAVDGMPGLVAILNPDGRIETVNARVLDYFGRPLDDAKNWATNGFFHPDDLAGFLETFKRAIAAGLPYQFEQRLRRHDGVFRWFDARGVPARDNSGKLVAWYVLLTDIDDRKRAEQALAQSERQFRQTFDAIPTLAWCNRNDGSNEFLNQRWHEYTGLTPAEANGWGWQAALHPHDLPMLLSVWKDLLATGRPGELEARLRRHDGVYRWFLFRCDPLRNDAGEVLRWYGTNTDIEDMKRAEQALLASEQHLQLTIDSLPALAWSARADGGADFFNKHYLDYVGRDAATMSDWRWTDVVHVDDLARIMSVFKECAAGEHGGQIEARLRRHDGAYRWFLLRTEPERDTAGAIVKWHGINTDIEDRKRAEALLAGEKRLLEMIASGEALREVLSSLCEVVEQAAPDCYCDIHLIDWSGPTISQSIAPSLPTSYTGPIAGAELRDDLVPCGIAANHNIQVISQDFDKDPRWCASPVRAHVREHGLRSVWSTPIRAGAGGVLGTLCIYQRKPALPEALHQDIIGRATHIASIAIERLRAQEDLRRSQTSLENAQHLTQTGSFTWNVLSDEVSASEQLRIIYEFPDDAALTSADIRGRTHQDDISILQRTIVAAKAAPSDPDAIMRLMMPDGRLKYVRAYSRLITHPDGRYECVGAVQDISDHHRIEEALNKVRADLAHMSRVTSLGTLTASIAHEVNQPLSGIITNANTCVRLLSADPPNLEGAIETARRTIRDGNRASEVITRLRALFRKTDFLPELLCLHDATREVIALSQRELRRNRVTLETYFAEDAPLIEGDRVQLQQVILNLLLNAIDALKDESRRDRLIAISTIITTDSVTLSVRDNGVGLTPDDLVRVFDAFYTTKTDGMGIGLSVSRSIVERHKGTLWAAPNHDVGTTFAFSLPRPPQAAGS